MSDSRTGRSPRTIEEWQRDMAQRVRRLENADSVRVGRWVISEQDGELVGTAPGRRVNLTAALAADTAIPGTGRTIATLTRDGTPTGPWRLVYRDAPTTDLGINATAAAILAAVLALSSDYTALDFDVTGDPGGPWRLVYPGGTLTVDNTGLTGGTIVIT